MSAVMADLADLMMPATERGPSPGQTLFTPPTQTAAPRALQKISYTHDGMIDLIVANPGMSQDMLAAHFGYSASWISQVFSSDAFQARLAERREALVDPLLRSTIEEQFKGIVARSLEVLRVKLDRPANDVPDQLALRAFELASRAAGYGAKSDPPASAGDVHIHLETLGDNLVGLLRRKKAEAQEAEFHEIRQTPQASPALEGPAGADAAHSGVSGAAA